MFFYFIDSDFVLFFSFCQKLEAGKSEPATSCGSSESLDDGSLESGSDRKSVEDNVNTDLLATVNG